MESLILYVLFPVVLGVVGGIVGGLLYHFWVLIVDKLRSK